MLHFSETPREPPTRTWRREPFDDLHVELTRLVGDSPTLRARIDLSRKDWLSWRAPPSSPHAYPCLRLGDLAPLAGEARTYRCVLSLWSDQPTADLIDLAEALFAELKRSALVQAKAYMLRPQPVNGRRRAIFPLAFSLKP